uniref:Uncharacterized protein n=1 Tax=Oryza barthii TaxID=65489 RepID=A0A0D3GZ54_9ORYZ
MGQKLWLANWHIAQEHNLRRDRVTSWLSDDFITLLLAINKSPKVNVGTHVFILHTGTGAHCRKKREVDFRTDRLPRAQMPSSVLLRSPSNRASLDPLDSGGRQAVGDGSAPPAECVGPVLSIIFPTLFLDPICGEFVACSTLLHATCSVYLEFLGAVCSFRVCLCIGLSSTTAGEARLRIAGRKLHRTEVLHSSKGLRPLT